MHTSAALASGTSQPIHYRESEGCYLGYARYVQDAISRTGAKRVLELGGGANPALPLEFVERHDLEYTVLDISDAELAKAPAQYRTLCCDIGSSRMQFDGHEGRYDLVFSKMLAEHVKDGEQMHRNVFRLLASGGRAIHHFPTMYAPPFVLNRLIPETLADRLLQWLEPGRQREGKHGKFPAYYSWCRGPTVRQLQRMTGVGYHLEEYIGFFGHKVYYQKLPVLRDLHIKLCRWLVAHPQPGLTSSAYVILVKP